MKKTSIAAAKIQVEVAGARAKALRRSGSSTALEIFAAERAVTAAREALAARLRATKERDAIRFVAQRLMRRSPTLDAFTALWRAETILSIKRQGDKLADRLLDEKGRMWLYWRGVAGRLDAAGCFNFSREIFYHYAEGLPLAAEGGTPLSCADDATFELGQRNRAGRHGS
jgi:hypothetical protein